MTEEQTSPSGINPEKNPIKRLAEVSKKIAEVARNTRARFDKGYAERRRSAEQQEGMRRLREQNELAETRRRLEYYKHLDALEKITPLSEFSDDQIITREGSGMERRVVPVSPLLRSMVKLAISDVYIDILADKLRVDPKQLQQRVNLIGVVEVHQSKGKKGVHSASFDLTNLPGVRDKSYTLSADVDLQEFDKDSKGIVNGEAQTATEEPAWIVGSNEQGELRVLNILFNEQPYDPNSKWSHLPTYKEDVSLREMLKKKKLQNPAGFQPVGAIQIPRGTLLHLYDAAGSIRRANDVNLNPKIGGLPPNTPGK